MISNVIRKEHEMRGVKIFSEPEKRIYPLIERIAQEFPHVKFEEGTYSTDYRYETDKLTGNQVPKCYIREYNVLDNGEHVGTIGFKSWGKFAYEITNDRIRKDLERGSTKKTTDLEKAVKLYKKYCYPNTIQERVKEMMDAGRRGLDRFHDTKRSDVRRGWHNLEDSIRAFVLANMEMFNAFVKSDALTKVRDNMEISAVATDMFNQFQAGQATMFTITDGKYIASRRTDVNGAGGIGYKELTREEMKPYDLQTIGMLKLLQKDEAILSRGYKVSDTCFIVFPEGDAEPNIVMENFDATF